MLDFSLKSIGAHMPREKSQRPEVYATGTREKLWKARYREYYLGPDGKERSRAKAATWSRLNHTKAAAQAKCDALIAALRQGPVKSDGAMTLAEFWKLVYLPIRERRWTGHTPRNVAQLWKKHIQDELGPLPLRDIKKAHVQLRLAKMASAGLGEVMLRSVLERLHSVMEEAVDNDYIEKNPCRRVEIPPCKPSEGTRSLTEAEVALLWDQSIGFDYIIWRLLILTGVRPGEMCPLTRMDITAEGLLIDEAVVNYGCYLPGGAVTKLPKGNKVRVAVLTASLRSELEEWLTTHGNELVFPDRRGKLYRPTNRDLTGVLARGRTLVPDLSFRMCRTTFASLFQGDEADRTSIMGHHSTAFTLERYRKPIMERRQKSVEDLEQRLRNVVPIRRIG